MAEQNNIRVILSDKAEAILEEIIKTFNLQAQDEDQEQDDSPDIVIDRLIKDFAKGVLSEKNFITSLKDNLKIPQETAEKLSKEIITKIIPLLEKIPEEKFNDPTFVDELSRRVFGEQKTEKKSESSDIFPKIKSPISVAEALGKNNTSMGNKPEIEITPAPRKQREIKKPVLPEENKNPPQQPKQRRGPDSYREPIE